MNSLIIGQGIAGTTVGWSLWRRGHSFVVVDRGDSVTASRVAAGLMTPATGKRRVTPPDFRANWQAAVNLYEFAEHETGATFFEQTPMLLLFPNEDIRDQFVGEDRGEGVTCEPWKGTLQRGGEVRVGVRIKPAGRLLARAYLEASRDIFAKHNQYAVADIDCDTDITIDANGVHVESLNLRADHVVLCTGSAASRFFPDVPNNPSRGDILTMRIPEYLPDEVVHGSLWVTPNSDGTQSVGATYDWKDLTEKPSAAGREELRHKLRRLVRNDAEVQDHLAAVRPTMKDYHPVIGQHPETARVFILNGLGSKGALKAPAIAEHLLNFIFDSVSIPAEISADRLMRRTPEGRAKPLTVLAQEMIQPAISKGDAVIDGTVGNGFDTVFLAEAVGGNGHVIGFDVQRDAIDSTRQRLTAKSLANVELRFESHQNIGELQGNSYSAVMFNLGYLPRGDHSVITQPNSSTTAIEAAIRVLKPGGILTVLSYRGHKGGPEEFEAVRRLLHQYSNRYHLQTIESTPARPTSPVLFVLNKHGVAP